MIGPLIHELALQYQAELLREAEAERLATQVPRKARSRALRIDIQRLLPPLHTKNEINPGGGLIPLTGPSGTLPASRSTEPGTRRAPVFEPGPRPR